MQRPSSCSGIPWRSARGESSGTARDGTARDVDQVLVVLTRGLVLIARSRRAVLVFLQHARVAARVVDRRLARLRLGVAAGHDHDAVVVARRVDRRLDRVEVALARQRPVDLRQLPRLLRAELPQRQARPQAPALGPGGADRVPQQAERPCAVLALTDDANVARSGAGDGGRKRAGLRHLAAGRRTHGGVGPGVGPVGGTLEMGAGNCRQTEHHSGHCHQKRGGEGSRARANEGATDGPFLGGSKTT